MKKFLSVILAALILVCPLSGFATSEVASEILEWNFCDDPDFCDYWSYHYKGNIALGETEITFSETYCDCYTFNAEKAGYYYVECLDSGIDWLGFPKEIKDGKAHLIADNCYISEYQSDARCVFKLDAGETVLGIDFAAIAKSTDTYNIKIEYLGNAITDIEFEEGVLDNLILDSDVFNWDSSYILSDVDAVFSEGRTITFLEQYIQISADNNEWVKGENKATAYFMDFKKSVVAIVCEITDVITDVEFVNLNEYNNIITTFDNYGYNLIYGAELVFTLASGEKINFNTDYSDYIEINGREYHVYAFYNHIDTEIVEIAISVSEETIKTFECNAVKSSFAEGSKDLMVGINESLKDSFYYSRVALSELLRTYNSSEFEDSLNDAIYYFERSFRRFSYCITLIRYFTEFYF